MEFGNRWVHLEDAAVVQQTDAAFLVRYQDEEHWIPKSQIADPQDYKKGDEGTISISDWIANKLGISV